MGADGVVENDAKRGSTEIDIGEVKCTGGLHSHRVSLAVCRPLCGDSRLWGGGGGVYRDINRIAFM